MKAGVYNRWLHQKGGGERHAAMAAAVLAERFDTELITHRAIARDELAASLNLDLARVGIRVIPALPPNRFRDFTRQYDLFVNASFMTSQPSAARRSMMLVLFPSPIGRRWSTRLRQAIGRRLGRELLLPEYVDGFYDVQELGRGWFRYTTDRATVKVHVPPGRGPAPVEIVAGNFRPAGALPVACYAGATLLGRHAFPSTPGNFQAWRLAVPRTLLRDRVVELNLECPTYNPGDGFGQADNREVGLAVADVRSPHFRHTLYAVLFRRMFHELGLRLEGLPAFTALDYLNTYDVLSPISEYSRRWMQYYWRRDGPILYPPVDISWARPLPKRNIILGVGRFFRGTHEKKHGVMIDQFVRMTREGLRDWTLHLAGHQSPRDIDRTYTEALQRKARGHPVVLHVNAPFDELRRLYGEARIYWHAAGYGEDERRDPVRFEHFGIGVVEAMASGAVPVVLSKGGLPELVKDGVDGFHWADTSTLRRRTWQLVRDAGLGARMAAAARQAGQRFDVPRFRARLHELVDGLGLTA
ncbi:MAG: glycosyltransferase [Actinobacteria bacterium]|nr:glycosyltransferase [Actinomycetota bacterium]